ncbi:MAG TPA: NAD-dependent epimerase/dehydratase family protein [Flavobacteriales bacterium]|nr:NAD-dependent epimerase/dehydratase family protein [Flavobacteriales bacterium]
MGILITGANGFVGRALLDRCVNGRSLRNNKGVSDPMTGAGLTAVVRSHATVEALAGTFAGIEVVSMNDTAALDQALSSSHTVVHLAWDSVPASANSDVPSDLARNVTTGLEFIERCGKAGVKRFIFLSSGGTVYGARCDAPHKESAQLDPIGAYGSAKCCFERYLGVRAPHYGMEHLVLRPANLYGRTATAKVDQGVVEHWLRSAAGGGAVDVWNGMEVVRDYVFIDDMVDVLMDCIASMPRVPVLNVGTGIGSDLHQLRAVIERVTGRHLVLNDRRSVRAGVEGNILDPSLLHSSLGPRRWVELEEGVDLLWRAMMKEGAVGRAS